MEFFLLLLLLMFYDFLSVKKHVLSKKKFQNFWSETNTFPYIYHIESLWVSLRSGRDCALAENVPRVMISIKFNFSDSQVNFTRACQFWSQLINQKK
jgi:hypothetical protein